MFPLLNFLLFQFLYSRVFSFKCSLNDYTQGTWEKSLTNQVNSGYEFCNIDIHQNCRKFGETGYLNFTWIPKSPTCRLQNFERSRFIDCMANKTLLIVGDSLARNQFMSLQCSLLNGTETDVQFYTGEWAGAKIPVDSKYIDGKQGVFNLHKKIYGMFSYLEPEALKELSSQYKNVSVVLIVSTGPWWHLKLPNDFADKPLEEQHEILKRLIVAIIDSLVSLPENFDIFWRGPDLHYCNDYTSKFITDDNFLQLQIYHLVKRHVAGTRVKFFDVFEITSSRPDGKIGNKYFKTKYDCLHWCLPGIPDTWNKIFANYICQ